MEDKDVYHKRSIEQHISFDTQLDYVTIVCKDDIDNVLHEWL
jgi:hypothetical protein